MEKLFIKLESLSKWYGIGVILIYSLLLAEFFSVLNNFVFTDDSLNRIVSLLLRVNYVVTVAAGMVVWIIMSLLFHLMALLFNGYAPFSRFLYASAYFYLIPAVFILAAILILEPLISGAAGSDISSLQDNPTFKLSMLLVNYSFIPYYLLCIALIYYLYKVRLWYAAASVVIPIFSIWAVSRLFSFI